VRSLGLDVGARKGCHAVVLDDRRVERREGGIGPDRVRALLEEERPDIVAIDAPSSFSLAGRSRASERDLSRRGIRIFFTPHADRAREHPWYEWMQVGTACFEAASAAGYATANVTTGCSGKALEVFPHASAVVIRGTLPAPRSSKVRRRRVVLESQGVSTGLRSAIRRRA
jgi:hypothetical protein